jgi:hypothetical protein
VLSRRGNDDDLALSDEDLLAAGDDLESGGQVAGPALLVDP